MSAAVESQKGWRKVVLSHFPPAGAEEAITVVLDPDDLLGEQTLLVELQARGYQLVDYGDPFAFRYLYEKDFRQLWDTGESAVEALLVRHSSRELDELPYDVVAQADRMNRVIRFSLNDLFPNLDPRVVRQLDRSHFDILHKAHKARLEDRLAFKPSLDFVLRFVYKLSPETVSGSADLLHLLLRLHTQDFAIPRDFQDRIVHNLDTSGSFRNWPVDELVRSKTALLEFLDERWPVFVRLQLASGEWVSDDKDKPEFKYSGPADLPLDDPKVRFYIDTFFQEDALSPIPLPDTIDISKLPEWVRAGIAVTGRARETDDVKLAKLQRRLQETLPGPAAYHTEWTKYALVWAEWSALRLKLEPQHNKETEALRQTIDQSFASWVQEKFASLHNLSAINSPAMVHHVAPHMAYNRSDAPARQALIVVDGLALDQWTLLRKALKKKVKIPFSLDETATFAWIPTLTSISRQSIFAGATPLYFPKSLETTGQEKSHWLKFWEERGLRKSEIQYTKEGTDQTDPVLLRQILELAENHKTQVLGVVVSKVDQLIHGTPTGRSGLQAAVKHWAESGLLPDLISALLNLDFDIYITSDHGNTYSHGVGKPNVGVLANQQGQRTLVFPDKLLRDSVAEDYPGCILWPQIALPENWNVLLAPPRGAFIPEGKQLVTHGGISLEEVIVPFVRIQRSDP